MAHAAGAAAEGPWVLGAVARRGSGGGKGGERAGLQGKIMWKLPLLVGSYMEESALLPGELLLTRCLLAGVLTHKEERTGLCCLSFFDAIV